MNNRKSLRIAFNVFIVILLAVLLVSISIHEYKVSIYGIKLKINYGNVIFVLAVFMLLRELFAGGDKWPSGIINRTLSPFTSGISGKKVQAFTGGLVFLIFWIILAVYDSLYDPAVLQISGYTPLDPSWSERITRIAVLLFCYTFPSVVIGSLLSWLTVSWLRAEKATNVIFYLAFLGFAFLSTSPKFALMNLDPFGPFSVADIIVFIILSFLAASYIPGLLLSGRYSKAIFPAAVVLIIFISYFTLSYTTEKSKLAEAGKKHTRVILITMDTTRGDHLSASGYNYSKETTPFLNKIANEGIVLRRTYAEMPTTDPSHTSIMTGTYPRTHGLLKNGMKVSNSQISYLQDWFKKGGFLTASITSRVFLVPEELGWPSFDYEHYPVQVKKKKDYIGKTVNSRFVAGYAYKRAKEWIDRNYDKDFFLWVHFWDPHWPYSPPKTYNSKFNSGFHGYTTDNKRRSFIKDSDKYTPEEIDYITSLYDGEISYTDKYVYKLVRYLEEKIPKSSNPPLIVITGDHGDSLGELQDKINYVFDHSETLHFGQMYVPLIVKWDGKLQNGKIFDELVESVDLAPTIVDLLGGKGTFKCDGKSFAPLLRSEAYEPKDAVFGQRRLYTTHPLPFVNVPEYSVTTKEWRLISNDMRGIELYDAIKDTDEENNVAEKYPDVVKILLSKLEDWKKTHKPAEIKTNNISKDKAQALKSLGYIQ